MKEGNVKVNHETSDRSHSLITAILFWCGLVVVSSLYITIPLVSVFAEAFKVSNSQAAWVGSAFSLCYAVGFLFFGPLSDRYGRKQIILFGLIVLTIVSPLIGLFTNLSWVIVLRAIQGIAAATFAPAALSYVVEHFPAEKRITTTGFVSTGFLMSGIVGQVFSSLISENFSWNYVFYILGGVYLITAILITFFIPTSNLPQIKGSMLDSFKQMGKVFAQKSLLLCYIITITLLLSFVGMYTTLGNYLSETFGLNSQDILYVRCAGILGMLVSPFSGQLVTKFGLHTVIRIGLSLAVLGLAILGFSSNLAFLIVMSVIFVAGVSITISTLISLVGQLGGTARGSAISLFSFILFMGATLGPIVAMAILNISSYLVTFELLALLLGIGLIASILIKSRG
ncbi:MFS transporter [Priestia megaterium]|uniref:MFS transporter n=1 Tax=Priestia megaterium TaxID=1404 RepID=A0A3D8WXA0_PRIMG|nr:MFS transporter [Priestia megaterium]MDH3171392.1 MFS transporter [Priestia megaterium]RDZ11105.1 MFS transporter [Priestia megaterium]